ncbi:MAG: GxxExxY protein [Bacteroidetes bacterium]|nr:GxxExxY protein [Bacteroidota bacterium]
MNKEERDPLTEKIIACCFTVHNELGPGFPERIYHNALKIVIKEDGLTYESEKEFDIYFKDLKIGKFRCDLVIGNKVIVEIKSVTDKMPILFHYQLLSYLKASKIKTGLLVNFGNKSCEIKRLSY